jgi:hypothetical protein
LRISSEARQCLIEETEIPPWLRDPLVDHEVLLQARVECLLEWSEVPLLVILDIPVDHPEAHPVASLLVREVPLLVTQ